MKKKLMAAMRMLVAVVMLSFATNVAGLSVAFANNGNQGGNGGNENCPAGTTELAKYNLQGNSYAPESGADKVTVTGNANGGTFTAASGYTVSAVVVKGSTDAKIDTYSPPVTSGSFNNTGLTNGGGNTPGISNIKFCGGVVTNTPASPGQVKYNDVCGTAQDTYTIPTTANVSYQIGGQTVAAGTYAATGTVTVTAVANPGYVLTSPYSFTRTFTNEACPLPQATPGQVTKSDVCGTLNDTYTIPTTANVSYQIGGQTVAAGTYTGSGSVNVTAVANAGYVLTAPYSVTHTFTNEACPPTPATAGVVTYVDLCSTANDTYTIPTTANVSYQVDGQTKAAGTYAASGTVTVTAVANPGYVLTAPYSFTNTFGNDRCPVTVTSGKVKYVDLCGTFLDFYTIPHTTGVNYQINGQTVSAGVYAGTGTVTVTAVAKPGYVLSSPYSFTYTFTNVACPTIPKPVLPGQVTYNDICATTNDTYTIPTTANVSYQVNGQTVAAGTYNGTGTVTVTAIANPGYFLVMPYSFTRTFTNVDCPTPPVVDVCPNIENAQSTVPAGYALDDEGNCVQPGGRGGDEPTVPTTTVSSNNVTTVASTVSTPELANTGDNTALIIMLGMAIMTAAFGSAFATRKVNI